MGLRGLQLNDSDIRLDADLDIFSPIQDRGAFLYDIWEQETGVPVARNPVEKHLIGEAIYNAIFEETGEYSALLKRCEMDRGSALPDLVAQFGESVKPRLKYLLEMYLLEVKENRLHVTPFFKHLLAMRQKLAAFQVLF